jgi:hypothetical protein
MSDDEEKRDDALMPTSRIINDLAAPTNCVGTLVADQISDVARLTGVARGTM